MPTGACRKPGRCVYNTGRDEIMLTELSKAKGIDTACWPAYRERSKRCHRPLVPGQAYGGACAALQFRVRRIPRLWWCSSSQHTPLHPTWTLYPSLAGVTFFIIRIRVHSEHRVSEWVTELDAFIQNNSIFTSS